MLAEAGARGSRRGRSLRVPGPGRRRRHRSADRSRRDPRQGPDAWPTGGRTRRPDRRPRDTIRRSASPCVQGTENDDVPVRRVRSADRRRARQAVPRPGRSAASPARSPRTSSSRCACRTASTCSCTRTCCASRSRTALLELDADAQARAHRAHVRQGYGHFTTRQNIQYNWPKLEDVPDDPRRARQRRDARDPDQRQLHPQHHLRITSPASRRTSSRIRGRTARCMRQWSTFHPEFAYLPRKFKIAVTGTPAHDRAAVALPRHRRAHRRRTPRASAASRSSSAAAWAARRSSATVIREFLPRRGPARYLEADPARLQPARPPRQQVQGAHQDPRERRSAPTSSRAASKRSGRSRKDGAQARPHARSTRVAQFFVPPPYETSSPRRRRAAALAARSARTATFARWVADTTCCRTRCPATASSCSR